MTLLRYIELYCAARLARALCVTPSFVIQMADGSKPVPVKRCVQIERATKGKVTRQELRSDWREVWPELDAIDRATRRIRGGSTMGTSAMRGAAFPRPTRQNKNTSTDDLLLSSIMRPFLVPLCRTRPTVMSEGLSGVRRVTPYTAHILRRRAPRVALPIGGGFAR